MRKPRVHIAAQCVVPKDAVSTDVLQMAAALRRAGHDSDIFASGIDAGYTDVVKPLSAARACDWSVRSDVLIYHHSTGWPEGEALIESTRIPIIVRYHNITPPEFFVGISDAHVEACRAGQRFTRQLARGAGATFWAASGFNAEELIEYGAPRERCRILPPLHAVESLADEPFDYELLAQHRSHDVRIIFVGGFKPNKGHERAIHLFRRYHCEVNRRSQLIFVGSMSPAFDPYVRELRVLADDLGLSECVCFSASVNASRLRSFYTLADVFLCVSDHEGFCVPLIEAMFFRVPIVAWGTAAVAETVGPCGLVWREYDDNLLVESIDEIVENTDLAFEFRRLGRGRYDSLYAPHVLQRQLTAMFDDAHRPARAVDPNGVPFRAGV